MPADVPHVSDDLDERVIREMIEQWADAVHKGDLDTVLADHADDIVMFDVPPPYEGVRGLDAYRATWPSFFEWQATGASFSIDSLEVTAGADVAFAHALLRCGTPEELAANPANRLRLTLGFRKQAGRWTVTHEHHSFPFAPEPDPARETTSADPGVGADHDGDRRSEAEVRDLHQRWFAHTAAKDLDAMLADIADDVVAYEQETPLRHTGIAELRTICKAGLDASGDAAIHWDIPELTVAARGDIAVSWGLDRIRLAHPDGSTTEAWSRATRVFSRRGGRWLLTHQHLSVPYDLGTSRAALDLTP